MSRLIIKAVVLLLAVLGIGVTFAWWRHYNAPAQKILRLLTELKNVPSVGIAPFYFGRSSNAIEADIQQMGSQAVPYLVNALRHPDPKIRWLAAMQLARIKDPSAVIPLAEALHDPEVVVRVWGAEALGEIGDHRAVNALVDCLGDRESGVRAAAARALGKLRDRRAVDPLTHVLDNLNPDVDPDVGKDAILALGALGDRKAIDSIQQAASKAQNDVIRTAAAHALRRLTAPLDE
jgi:HEAT repeat protein